MKPAAAKGGAAASATAQLIKKGDASGFKKILDKPDAGLDAKGDKGRNMLMIACAEGQADIAKLLLSKKASLYPINAVDDEGNTVVMLACEGGWSKVVELLFKQNPKLDIINKKGNTILHALFWKQKWLGNELKCVKLLLPEKKPVLDKTLINHTNNDNLTALQLACMRGHYDGAMFLLKNKADATIVKSGDPPLFAATYAENPALVKALLAHGADIGQSNAKHQSLLEIVNPKSEIYRILKNHMLTTPGGERKMKMASEDFVIATKPEELPQDVQRMIQASGIPQQKIIENWEIFCTCLQFASKKRIFPKAADAEAYKENKKNTTAPISDATQQLGAKLLTPGDPTKLYKKLHVAGRGGFGMVFAGTGPDKKEYAIKRMPHSSEKDKRANFTEANFLKNAKHPNICAYIATYECEAQHEIWIIMELLDGGNLDEGVDIESDSRFEERHIAYAAREMLQGLNYLHSQKPPIAHRDLKAANVMMTVSGDVKLIDFGLSLEVKEGGKVELCGSPFWLPPEMIRKEPHNIAADIWSMAVCLLELANKKAPNSDSALRSMFTVGTGTAPGLDKPDKWGTEMKAFLELCLQTDQRKRATAADLLKHPFLTKACNKGDMATLLRAIFVQSAISVNALGKVTM